MKKRVSPGIYNIEMELKYRQLYHVYKKLIKLDKNSKEYIELFNKFEIHYYKTSKMNRILNEYSKNKDEIIKYLEPTSIKRKVDEAIKSLGIIPYEELDKREEEFIIV